MPHDGNSGRGVQRQGSRWARLPSMQQSLLSRLLALAFLFLLSSNLHLPRTAVRCVGEPSSPSSWWWCRDDSGVVDDLAGANAPRSGDSDSGVLPRILLVAAAAEAPASSRYSDAPQKTDRDGGASRAAHASTRPVDYDRDLKPSMTPWREVRRALHDAGCFHAYPYRNRGLEGRAEATTADDRDVSDTERLLHAPPIANDSRAPDKGAPNPSLLPPLCRKPLVLMSGRTRGCETCTSFATDILQHYSAEWAYVRAYVTLVDAGDSILEQLERFPYPPEHSMAELSHRLALARHPRRPSAAGDAAAEALDTLTNDTVDRGAASLLSAPLDTTDLLLFHTRMKDKASALLRRSAQFRRTRHWSRLVEGAFAGQSEYMLRIVFAYPHNGSVMQDIVNEDIGLHGSFANHLHLFLKAEPFFHCVRKAVQVMAWLRQHGDF